LCPDVCQQYFDEAKPGEMFIVSGHGPGNVGYRHAVEKLGARLRPELRPDVKELFYRQLEASLEGMGVPALNPFDSSMTDAGAIAENTDHLRMMLAGYNSPGFSLPPPAPARLDGVWMLPPFSNYPLRGEAEELARAYAARVREAAEAGDGPTFLYMWVLGNTFIGDYSFLRHLKNEVGGEAVFVTPTQMAELLDEARKRGEL
jgi:hypothetical protein